MLMNLSENWPRNDLFEDNIIANYPLLSENNDYMNFSSFEDENNCLNPFQTNNITIGELDETPIKEKIKQNENFQNNIKKKERKIKMPVYYSPDNIKKLLEQKQIENISNLFLEDQKLTDAEDEMQLIRKKKIRSDNLSDEGETESDILIEIKYKRGRKGKNDMTERYHNKFKDDNIMKKTKSKIFEYVIKYVNAFCEEYNNVTLKELNYKKYIDHLRKKDNLKYLHLPLKEILSLEISPRFKNEDANSNKTNIEMILDKIQKEEYEEKNSPIKNLLNMELREWIDIFTMKKDIESLGNISEVVKSKLPTITDLMNDILNKNHSTDYLSLFLFYLYNYEKWFINRTSRKRN
jgi:hypothetical protein